jgi:hypothetical protein
MPSSWRVTLYGVALVMVMTPCRAASGEVVHVFHAARTRLERGDRISVTERCGAAEAKYSRGRFGLVTAGCWLAVS